MAQRMLFCKTLKQTWACLKPSKCIPNDLMYLKGNSLSAYLYPKQKLYANNHYQKALFFTENSVATMLSERTNSYIDLYTPNPHKKLYMPTISINKLKVYEDIALQKTVIDPVVNNIKIIDAPVSGRPEKKEAVRMILIRRRKMRKHKLRKLRKRMKFVFAKIKMKKELRKEQAFRTELLGQVEVADKFDAKVYVEDILKTIRNVPKEETVAEIKERYRQLKKLNKYNTHFIKPKFDD